MYRLRSSRSRYPYFFLHRGQREAETLKMSVSITTSVGHFGGRKFAGGRQGAKLIRTPNMRSVQRVWIK